MSRTFTAAALLAVAVCSSNAAAQIQTLGTGEPVSRLSSRVFYWDAEKSAPAGQIVVNYGSPEWKSEYNEPEKTHGKFVRLGKDFWTVLDTNVKLKVGTQVIPAGGYFLAVHRSDDGAKWSLVLLDPAKVRQHHMDAFQTEGMDKALPSFQISLTHTALEEEVAQLRIVVAADPENPKDVTFSIEWGPHKVSTKVVAEL